MNRFLYPLRLLMLLPVLFSILLSFQPAFAHDFQVRDAEGNLHAPVEVTLVADRAPAPGELVNLHFTVTPYVAMPEIEIRWQANGGELLGGATSEKLTGIGIGQTVQVSRQVRFADEGIYEIGAAATIHPHDAMQYANGEALYFTVKRDGSSTISPTDPTIYNPMGSIMVDPNTVVVERVNAAGTDDELCFEFSGTIERTERTPTTSGYAADTKVPVHHAYIEVREEDVLWDDTYGEALTDKDGNYKIEFCTDPSFFEGDLELYVRLNAQLYNALDAFEVVYVEDSSYVDEMYYYDSGIYVRNTSSDITYSPVLDDSQSQVFNIADAMFQAWRFWDEMGGSSIEDFANITAEVHWEPGYVEVDSELNTFYDMAQEEITIGAVNDPDAWDESSMMHEYGHMMEDNFSCDESLGGAHSSSQLLDDVEFAWSEGYPNYFQSVARQAAGIPQSDIYIDIVPAGVLTYSLELWNVARPALVSEFNEAAIAAMFWDLQDTANDGQDRVSFNHRDIQEVYTGADFADQFGDEECSVNQFFQAWQAADKFANGDVAAVAMQNTGVSISFNTQSTLAASEVSSEDASQSTNVTNANQSSRDYQWWKHLIMLTDRSKSMEGAKINAVKSVLTEQVNDIPATSPKGVEFSLHTFDNSSTTNKTVVSGKFYPEFVTPAINSLTTNTISDACQVDSFRALTQAIANKKKGDAWLFTDGDAVQTIRTETLIKSLNSHQLKGSIALLGICDASTPNALNTSGATKNYLGKAANATQSGGIVPYLLTAIGSGGQFLYVDPSKIDSAADILRAQLSHSAGAGRWSDYVSDQPTYLYDKLNSWEYKWIDTSTAAGGVNQGVPNEQVSFALPAAFPFYGVAQNNVHVTRYGYLTFGAAAQTVNSVDVPLPNAAVPNNALYPLWFDMVWNNPPAISAADVNAPDALQASVFSRQEGEWFAIETNGTIAPNTGDRAYQVLLNNTTGEIRYQYKTLLANEAGNATIGLENANGTSAVQVSHNDGTAASNGMGYKFTPAPAQPSQTYSVSVDAFVTSVGFLLTGFSGSFDPLQVRTPDNTLISCADTANVLCLNLELVQYVQVKTNGRNGLWKATVSAGASGGGTYMFSSIGASTVTAESNSERSLPTAAKSFEIGVGRAVTGNQVQGWFTKPNGERFGNPFNFFDDGAHNDGKAGDGRFGSDNFTPPGASVAYLWIKGSADGNEFIRSEPTPFNFQPLEVTSLGDGINTGDVTVLVFEIKNLDSVKHCYDRAAQVPDGWFYDWKFTGGEFLSGVCIEAGQSVTRSIEIKMAAVSPNTLPSGSSGEVTVSFIEKEEGSISDSASAIVTRRRAPANITLLNELAGVDLRPNGVDTTTVVALVFDAEGMSVADGTEVNLSSTLGSITPVSALTQQGRIRATLTAGNAEGNAVVTAMVGNLVATTTVGIRAPAADLLVLTSAATQLPVGVNSTPVTATVRDEWGSPMAGQTVRIGVSGDGDLGTINGSEVMTATTNASGQVIATFARGTLSGKVAVRAELIVQENGQPHVAREESVEITVLDANSPSGQAVYLPLVSR